MDPEQRHRLLTVLGVLDERHQPGKHPQINHAGLSVSLPQVAASNLSDRESALRRAADALIAHGGTAWHVAHKSFRPGDDLVARDRQDQYDIETDWKWGDEADEGFDGDAVALFPDTPEGRQEADWLWSEHPEYVLLRVEVPPADERDRDMRRLDEGYPAVIDDIPNEWITVVRRGYDETTIGVSAVPPP